MSDLGFRSGSGSPDFPDFPGFPCPRKLPNDKQSLIPFTCSDSGPTNSPQPIDHDSAYLKLFVESDGLYPDAIASRTESSELIAWARGEDTTLYDKPKNELSPPTTQYSFPTNDIPFGLLDGNWSLQGSSSDSNSTALPSLANSIVQPGSARFVRLEDIERNGAAPNFEVENWHVDLQNCSIHMLGLEGPETPASIPNYHDSMEEIPYTNTELSAGHAVNDQSTQVPHPGRNILSHRKRRPPQTQTHTAGLPIGRSSSRLTTRTSTNAVPGSQIRPTVHQATAPIKEWFDAHRDSPYASNEEKAALANSTGLTLKQISDCLSNLRARKLLKGNTLNSTKSASENEASSIYSPVNIPPMSSRAIGTPPVRSSSTDFPQLPELLQNAIENKVHGSVEAGRKLSHQSSSAMTPELPSSPSVPEDLRGVARLDFGRKGKKRFMRTLNPASEGTHALTNDYKDEDGWSFQCTFCLKRCKNSYEWKRHEGTHVVARTWTCMPENVATKGNRCVFCDLKFPSLAHLGEHNIHVCLKKALPARTFARKDHLKQHIKQVHLPGQDNGFSNLDEILDCWSRDADESEFASGVLWCSFCSTSFKS